MCLELVIARLLTVFVEIDETGRNHQSLGLDHRLTLQGSSRDSDDFASRNTDVTDFVQPGLGIHHVPTGNDDVKLFASQYRLVDSRHYASQDHKKSTEKQHSLPGQPSTCHCVPSPNGFLRLHKMRFIIAAGWKRRVQTLDLSHAGLERQAVSC